MKKIILVILVLLANAKEISLTMGYNLIGTQSEINVTDFPDDTLYLWINGLDIVLMKILKIYIIPLPNLS